MFNGLYAPVPRFCVANECGRVIFPQPFQHESDFCNICLPRIWPYNSFAIANDKINGDASQILQSGEFPHELRGSTFREPGGSNHVPLALSTIGSGHPPSCHIPPSLYIQQPQPIPHLQTLDPDEMRFSYNTYSPDVFAGTSQRVSDRNVLSNTDHSGLPHGQPTLQLYCEKCHIFMSNHLVGDGRVCSRCLFQYPARKPAVSAKPSSPLMNPDSFMQIIDLTSDGDVHASMTGTASDVNTISAPPNRIEIRPPFPQQEFSSDLSPPPKRQRIDEGLRNASTESNRNTDQLAIPAKGNVLKICSIPSCDQTIPVESCSSRCTSCVKLDWKSIKDQFKPPRSHHKHEAGNALPSALAKSTKAKSRKSVTWSDMVTVASEQGTVIQCLARDIEKDNLSISGNNEQDGSVNTRAAAHLVDTTGKDMDMVASITGWDSELSELSVSDESDSSDDSPQISAPTGLKIRIPARSSIFCSRKCRNPICSQVLAANYPAKTCMICRAHQRQMQQRRKGLHDEEDITLLDGKPPKFIPNARLCSANGCTHFIPPQQEYKFKRCSLCRLYQEERRLLRQRGPNHQSDSIKPLVDVKEIYNSFRFLPVRSPTTGRCPSLDCGLFHEGGSTSCRQCVLRRAKLMKKAGIQEERRGVSVKQHRPPPELNIYPQYICHSFLVSDFEGRLKAFLKSQTVFSLFRVHHPTPVGTKALFSFDGEYSVVALDFDVVGRKTEIDVRTLGIKKGLEGIEGLKFMPKRLISILEGGGVAIRFLCTYQASILRPIADESVMAVTEAMKPMTGELEIAVFPDHSHRCLPGEKTIIRFRLLG